MSERMAIVPVEASEEVAWLFNPEIGASMDDLLSASPHAGKVSPEQHRAAMVALQNSKWPFMPTDQWSEIVDIVIASFGLEKAE